MSESEQVEAFAADLRRVIDRYCDEFEMTVAAAIGTLEVVKLDLYLQQSGDTE